MFFFFFFNDTATTEIYTLSLHDALPILQVTVEGEQGSGAVLVPVMAVATQRLVLDRPLGAVLLAFGGLLVAGARSEEHTSELQSQSNLVCRLLLEKKKRRENLTPETLAS